MPSQPCIDLGIRLGRSSSGRRRSWGGRIVAGRACFPRSFLLPLMSGVIVTGVVFRQRDIRTESAVCLCRVCHTLPLPGAVVKHKLCSYCRRLGVQLSALTQLHAVISESFSSCIVGAWHYFVLGVVTKPPPSNRSAWRLPLYRHDTVCVRACDQLW